MKTCIKHFIHTRVGTQFNVFRAGGSCAVLLDAMHLMFETMCYVCSYVRSKLGFSWLVRRATPLWVAFRDRLSTEYWQLELAKGGRVDTACCMVYWCGPSSMAAWSRYWILWSRYWYCGVGTGTDWAASRAGRGARSRTSPFFASCLPFYWHLVMCGAFVFSSIIAGKMQTVVIFELK